jgi:membrane protein implicated in regulation of membrane protease activity
MRRIAVGSIMLWFLLAIYLSNAFGGSVIVPLSIVMLAGLAVIRFSLWRRYRQDMRTDLASQDVAE